MAVTRIKNNQITDSTITFQKIAPGTLVGSLFNPNLTLNSNVSINGNLSIAGNTTTINSIDTLVSDSLITLNNGYVGVPSYDVGILFNRALGTLQNYGGVNAALVWSESDGAFIAVLTTETGTTAGTINRAFQANMIVGNLTVSNAVTAQTATITTLNATNTNLSTITATGNIVAASGTNATNYTTGAIVVPGGGGVGITGDLWVQGPSTFAGNIVAGNIVLSGNINVPVGGTFSNTGVFFGNAGGIGALYAGTSTYTALPTTVLQLSGNVDSYAQVNFQNINSGASASTDFVLTADNGDDNDGYINLGINSSTFNDPAFAGYYPDDGYLIMHGLEPSTGNLNIHSHNAGSVIKLIVGAFGDANVRATVTNTGFRVNTATASTSSTSGALIVDGGVGIGGNIHAAAINATPVGNTTPSTGVFTNLTATDVNLTTLVATNLSTGNVVISGGYISALANASVIDLTATNLNSTNGNITTLVATNFSTANAQITGGYADNFPIGANTAAPGTFTFANATTIFAVTTTSTTLNTTNGNITTVESTTANLNTVNAVTTTSGTLNSTTGNITTLAAGTTTTETLNSTNGNVTTLVANNFSTGNAVISGGYADNFPIGANTAAPGTFTFANATTVFAGTTTTATLNSTTGNITTLNAGETTTANLNSTNGNITNLTSTSINTATTTSATINSTTANITNAGIDTLVANNFSTANAQITGGYADNFPIGANTAAPGTFTTLTATTGNLTTINSTSANLLNATIGNITIAGGSFSIDTINAVNGNIITLVSNNFSTANAQISGGYADNFPIGANTAAAGAFTTLTASGSTTFTSAAQSDNSATGAVVITGGLGVGANLNVGGNVTIQGNLTVIGNTTILNTENLNVEDKNITIAANATTPNDANGAGLTVAGANATFTYSSSDDSWNVNKNLNADSVKIVSANVTHANITTIYAANIGTANAIITGGNIDVRNQFDSGVVAADSVYAQSAEIDSLLATSANILGGIGTFGNLTVDNISSGNVLITGGYIDGTVIGANVPASGTFTTFNTSEINVSNGNITTLVTNNFSTANAQITGGYADNFPIGANVASTGTFTSIFAQNSTIANTNSTNGNITTLVANNFSTANAQITGGYADNFPIGANVASTGTFTFANATTGYLTTLVAITSNTSTLNATTINVTDGNITTLSATTVNSTIATIVDLNATTGNITTLTSPTGNFTTLFATNFSTGNAVISGGYISALTNAAITTANITNLISGNASITGGFADNFPIGANTASTGAFTTVNVSGETKTSVLNATSNVYLSPQSGSATVTINPLVVGTIDNMSIGQTGAANVYASNFRAATSLWAATTGPVWIRGGTGLSGINNIPIGAVTPSTGSFTTFNGQTVTGTTVNATNGNVTTLVATNFSSGNILVTGGNINALTNAYITLGQFTNFSTANALVTGGYADNFPIGANTAATGRFTTITAASLNGAIIGNVTPAAGTFTNLLATGNLTLATGNIVISSGNTTVYTGAAGTANTTGALVITGTGGAAINGNVYIGQGAVINGNRTTNDTIVRGVNERSLLYVAADNTYDQVSIGGNITTSNIVQGAKLAINSNDSLLLPVGTTAERPGSQGFTDVDGMIRFNTTINDLEFYGGGQWNNTGSTFTVIASRTFSNSSGDLNGNVDGINTQFTLGSDSTTAATLVSINGVIQIPTTAYSVTGNVVAFTEAPALGDVIDTRVITTTSTLIGLASLNGFNQFIAENTSLDFYTGNVTVGAVQRWTMDQRGNFVPLNFANIGSPSNRVNYFYGSNINLSGGSITGATVSSGSLDDTVIGGNVARAGTFTTLNSNSTFTTNAEVATDDLRGQFISPNATDNVYGFPIATYRSAKYFVQLTDEAGGEYQATEIIGVHNGTTMNIEVYGVTFTGVANLATFSSNISSGIAYLNASSAGANLKVKVTPTLMKI